MNEDLKRELLARRAQLRALLGEDTLLLFAAEEKTRNADSEYPYRQDSNFLYLTSFKEPGAAFLLSPKHGAVLFLREKDRSREVWEGRRLGTQAAAALGLYDQVLDLARLEELLPDYLEDVRRLQVVFGEEELIEPRVAEAWKKVRARRRKRVTPPAELVDARLLLSELRLKKSQWELKCISSALAATERGHRSAMNAITRCQNEAELERILENGFREAGCREVAYGSIVGAGDNATILHYRENNAPIVPHSLVLIDAGAEYEGYAADVTRTYPSSGRFTPAQAEIYQAVLKAQKLAINACIPGNDLEAVHELVCQSLAASLQELGVLGESATKEELRKQLSVYYMHKTSHYLGLDVHDVGTYFLGAEVRKLEAGMLVTIEPGLYFAADDESVPECYRGIGVRIEDDVLITPQGPVVLSSSIPKEIAELEALCLP